MADSLLAPAADPSPAETLGAPPAEPEAPANPAPADPAQDAAARLYPEGQPKPEGEPKPESEEPKAEGDDPKPEDENKEPKDERYGAPEGDANYETFTLPDGFEIDDASNADLNALGKELNLSQDSAQKLVDKVVEMRQRDAEKLEAVHTSWVDQAKADKEFGGDKLNESLATAQKALKEFGTPELGELLTGARLGNHPEVIRLLVRVGKSISDAPIVNGGKPVQTSTAKTLYPSLK